MWELRGNERLGNVPPAERQLGELGSRVRVYDLPPAMWPRESEEPSALGFRTSKTAQWSPAPARVRSEGKLPDGAPGADLSNSQGAFDAPWPGARRQADAGLFWRGFPGSRLEMF